MCLRIETVMERMSSRGREFCGGLRWAPRRWGFAADDALIALVERDIFRYARKNLALLNVYIKVGGLAVSWHSVGSGFSNVRVQGDPEDLGHRLIFKYGEIRCLVGRYRSLP